MLRPLHHHRFQGQSWPHVRFEIGQAPQRRGHSPAQHQRARQTALRSLFVVSSVCRGADHLVAQILDRGLHHADHRRAALAELLAQGKRRHQSVVVVRGNPFHGGIPLRAPLAAEGCRLPPPRSPRPGSHGSTRRSHGPTRRAVPRSRRLRSTAGSGIGRTATCWHRERTVASSVSDSSARSRIVTAGGGSSSVFRSACCAGSSSVSASSTMTMRRDASSGRSAADDRRCRTVSILSVPRAAGFSANLACASRLNVSTSGCAPRWTFRHARHTPQEREGSSGSTFVQQSASAKARASAALPTPRCPVKRYACPTRSSRMISRNRADAAGSAHVWPTHVQCQAGFRGVDGVAALCPGHVTPPAA